MFVCHPRKVKSSILRHSWRVASLSPFHRTVISRVFSFISIFFLYQAARARSMHSKVGEGVCVCVCIWLRRYKVNEPNARADPASVLLPLVRICLMQYASNSVKIASGRRRRCCACIYGRGGSEKQLRRAFYATFVWQTGSK